MGFLVRPGRIQLRRRQLRASLAMLLVGFSAATTEATVWEVPSFGIETIQDALDFAANGDEIRIAPGTYSGPRNRDLDLRGLAVRLVGTGGAAVTVLDCEGAEDAPYRALIFDDGEGPGTEVVGLTLANGFAGGESQSSRGGAIFCAPGTAPTIRGCVIRNSFAWRGGGVFVSAGSSPKFFTCRFEGNITVLNGGGLSSIGGQPEIVDCEFVGNLSEKNGGAVGFQTLDGVSLIRCRFESNTAVEDGTVFADRSTIFLQEPLLVFNEARRGGALFSHDGSTIDVDVASIVGNVGTANGGAAYARLGAGIRLRRTLVWSNCGPEDDNEFELEDSSRLIFECSRYDPAHVVAGGGTVEELGDQVYDDPLLCGEARCGNAFDPEVELTLNAASPCAASNSPCGEQIGTFGVACGDPVPTIRTSWGRIKDQWRRP